MNNLIDIQIPFSGFYESIHDRLIDEAIENGFNYDYETGEEIELTDEVKDAIFSTDIDWDAIRLEYCKHYVNAFGDEFGLDLTFDEMTSPKFYNYETDRIFCKVPAEQINKIRVEVYNNDSSWRQYLQDNFSDCDGHWSNYSNDPKSEDWTKETLDACQYGAILSFWLNNISERVQHKFWNEKEYFLTEDFEMFNWDSIIEATNKIKQYLKEAK